MVIPKGDKQNAVVLASSNRVLDEPRVRLPPETEHKGIKNSPTGNSYSFVVNRVESNWNYLVSDIYRIKGIINVLYPTNYIPGLTRTEEYNPKH